VSTKEFREIVRRLVANYMASEGCSCCQDIDQHAADKAALAEILKVPPYDDNSGFAFGPFKSPGR